MKFTPDHIRLAANIRPNIEIIDGISYQVKFEELSSIADKAYRVLYEVGHPLHYKVIHKEIVHRMNATDPPCDLSIRSLMRQLTNERTSRGRFAHIGYWSLSEWKNVCRDTVFDLMREYLYSRNSAATQKEINEYVNSKRLGVLERTLYTYLSKRIDVFTTIGKNLYGLNDRQSTSG